MAIRILYEDRYLSVCEKPVGVLSESSAGKEEGGLPSPSSCMPALLSETLGGSFLTVHRLDQGVGGLMVYARDAGTAGKLSAMVAQRDMTKEYFCVVHGCPAQASGTLTDLLYRDPVRNKSFVVNRMRKGVREAVLDYVTLAGSRATPWGEGSLLRVTLGTGRSHQIRVQFASRGMPLIGDGKYGGSDNGTGIALWSCHLAFRHPVTRKQVDIRLLPPEQGVWQCFAKESFTWET